MPEETQENKLQELQKKIKVEPAIVVHQIYTLGTVSMPITLSVGKIVISTLNTYEVELFNLLFSNAVNIMGENISQNMFNLLYSRWLLPFIVDSIALNNQPSIEIKTDRKRIVNAYKNAQLLLQDEFQNKINDIKKEVMGLQEKISEHLSIFLVDKILEEYNNLTEYVRLVMEQELKN